MSPFLFRRRIVMSIEFYSSRAKRAIIITALFKYIVKDTRVISTGDYNFLHF